MASFITKIPGYGNLRILYRMLVSCLIEKNLFATLFFPGHYYSALPSIKDLRRFEKRNFDNLKTLPGIDLNEELQLKTLKSIGAYARIINLPEFKTDGWRYYWQNEFYSYGDGIILQGMIQLFAPQKIIEVGSGHSSALMLDINEKYFGNSISLTFIEPYPDRLNSLINETDKNIQIIKDIIQNVETDFFKSLNKNDILLIDSSHVGKLDSDLLHILFEIIPILKPGVLIHFHDVFWPFEYPLEWSKKGVSWNEVYFIRALLQFSKNTEILLMSDYLNKFHGESFDYHLNCQNKSKGYNLWIKIK